MIAADSDSFLQRGVRSENTLFDRSAVWISVVREMRDEETKSLPSGPTIIGEEGLGDAVSGPLDRPLLLTAPSPSNALAALRMPVVICASFTRPSNVIASALLARPSKTSFARWACQRTL